MVPVLWAVEVVWDRATRLEARDFCRWLAGRGHRSLMSPDERWSVVGAWSVNLRHAVASVGTRWRYIAGSEHLLGA